MKICNTCHVSKPKSEYYAHPHTRDGLLPKCKECQRAASRAARERRPEHYRAQKREYARANRDAAKQRIEKWLSDPANAERKRRKDREWRKKNLEHRRAVDREYSKKNRDRMNASARAYAARHPELIRLRGVLRRARREGAPRASDDTRAFVQILLGDSCSYCGEPMTDVDHIEPLTKGGGGEWDNLTAACGSCNKRKQTKPMLSFLLGLLEGDSNPPQEVT